MLTVHLNNRSSILQGASLPVISGGEFNSSEGDHNRITITIRKTLSSELRFLFKNWYLVQGVPRQRDDRHEAVSGLSRGQPLFR
jgi:N-acetyl-gamma-glutamyl-phosphate reductase/acetylglutamate kinase